MMTAGLGAGDVAVSFNINFHKETARVGTNKHPRGPGIDNCLGNRPMRKSILLPRLNLWKGANPK